MRSFGVKTKLISLVALFVVGLLGLGAFASHTIDQVKVLGPICARTMLGKDLVADVLPPPEYIIENYLLSLQALDETDPQQLRALVERGDRERAAQLSQGPM
jgi:methyl-accepting chemotaxis protein